MARWKRWLWLLVALAAVLPGRPSAAQDPADFMWLSRHRDPANSSSTGVVLGDDLKILWEGPVATNPGVPLVYRRKLDGTSIVVSGDSVLDAWTGDLLFTLPSGYYISAIDAATGVLLMAVPTTGDASGHVDCHAYDLENVENDWAPMWTATNVAPGYSSEVNARDGVFCVSGDFTVVALDSLTGEVLWQQTLGGWQDIVALDDERIYVGNFAYGDGVATLFREDGDHTGGTLAWQFGVGGTSSVCVDNVRDLVYVALKESPQRLEALDAVTGVPVWTNPVPVDFLLNGAPTLGRAQSRPAIFAVTGGVDGVAEIYAVDRRAPEEGGGELIWHSTIPSDAWTSATYCGAPGGSGKLYLGGNDGLTYVLNADTGQCEQVLGTIGDLGPDKASRVGVRVLDPAGDPHNVMYYLTDRGTVEAWSVEGTGTRSVGVLSLVAEPAQIAPFGQSTVTATVFSDNGPVEGRVVNFSYNPEHKSLGRLLSTTATTDVNGEASVVFGAYRWTGTATVSAEAEVTEPATVDIRIVKESPTPPPAAAGSIQGTVYYNGKPARKLPVTLLDGSDAVVATTTTNPKGKYAFDGLAAGDYVVEAEKNGSGDSQSVVMPDPPEVVGGVDLHL